MDDRPRSRDEALTRLHAITVELVDLHRERATIMVAEKTAKLTTWAAQGPTTDKQRDHSANVNALEHTNAMFSVDGEIAALVEERDYLRTELAYNTFTQ